VIKKSEEQARRIKDLAYSCDPYGSIVGYENARAIVGLGDWALHMQCLVSQDKRWHVWPELSREHLDPVERWVSDFSGLSRGKSELAKDTLTASAQAMVPLFQSQFAEYREQYHAADVTALKTADSEVSGADPRTRIPLTKRQSIAELQVLDSAHQTITDFYNQLWREYEKLVPESEREMIVSIHGVIGNVRESIVDTEQWDALKPFNDQYLKPFERMILVYKRLVQRQIKSAHEVIADVHVRMLPLFKTSMVAFHNQLHVHQIARLQATEVELSAEARVPARSPIGAAAPAMVEIHADAAH
jgi:hypothetical protein